MISLHDWLGDLSKNYSVQHVDKLEGIVIAPINRDYFLVKHVELKGE